VPTPEQRRRFADDGFFVVEDALTRAEVVALLAVVDAVDAQVRSDRRLAADALVRVRNIVCRHPAFLRLVDHPRLLPLVVGMIGPRIQIRGSNLDVRPTQSRGAHTAGLGAADSFFPWHRDEPYEGWPTVNGVPAFLELKVGLYLTDLRKRESGAICLVRGSHARSPRFADDGSAIVDPDDIVEINVSAGTALVWRTALLHCVAPNFSSHPRKCLYLAYQHRWLRPSDYISVPEHVLAQCSPIQRQLLGSGGDRPLIVHDPDVEPCSPYWTPAPDEVPLEAWAAARGLTADHDIRLTRDD
jgi:hypothetical protein